LTIFWYFKFNIGISAGSAVAALILANSDLKQLGLGGAALKPSVGFNVPILIQFLDFYPWQKPT
jgi:hypothetical protein